MNAGLFEYKGDIYPTYLRDGNAMRFIEPIALQFCKGDGIDIGAGKWSLPGARPIDIRDGFDALALPDGQYDFAFSSHCLEHLANYVYALEHWKSRIKPGGVLFLYLPHPSQKYWNPAHCKKHMHIFHPKDIARTLEDIGFVDVIHSGRDLNWSFSVVGWNT